MVGASVELRVHGGGQHRGRAVRGECVDRGIPHAIVIGDRGLDNCVVEYKCRRSGEKQEVAITDIVAMLKAKLGR